MAGLRSGCGRREKALTKLLRNPVLALVCRLVVGAVLIHASVEGAKFLQPALFADAVANYRILPQSLVNIFAIVLVWTQLVTGICLIIGLFAPGASLVASGMFAMFLVAIVSAVTRGLNIDCGCFNLSGEGEKVAWQSLWMRGGLLALSLIALVGSSAIDWPARLLAKGGRDGDERR